MTHTPAEMREMAVKLDWLSERFVSISPERDIAAKSALMLRQAADAMEDHDKLAKMVADGNFNQAEVIALARKLAATPPKDTP